MGGSGLVVLTVVRQFGPRGMQPFMRQNGYPVFAWQSEITGLTFIQETEELKEGQTLALLAEFDVVAEIYGQDYHRTIPTGKVLGARQHGYCSLGDTIQLVVSLGPYVPTMNFGDGSETNPYQITTAGELDWALNDALSRNVVLMNDIDMTGYPYHPLYHGNRCSQYRCLPHV